MKDYTVHATITYLDGNGYKVSAFIPGRGMRVYTAQTFSDGIKAIARELKDISNDLNAYAKALDDTGPFVHNLGRDLKI